MEDYIATFRENMCIYLEMKYETLDCARYLSVEFSTHLFLYNLNYIFSILFGAHKYTIFVFCVIQR